MSLIVENVAASPSPSRMALEQQLRTSPYWAVRQLVCQIDRNRVIIRGTVPSYYLKQVAESLASKAVGLECVASYIDVQSE